MPTPPPSRRPRWIAAALVALVLYWPLAFAATHFPLRDLAHSDLPLDKVFHFGSYAVLAVLLTGWFALRHGWRWKGALWAVAIAAVYGIVDELTQIPVPGRTADAVDWLADVSGASAGAILTGLLLRRR